jgi:hypothetical protein
VTHNRQDEVLAHARQATNALARLLADTRQLDADALAPGLWQIDGYSLAPAPFSFTALQACGALTPSGQGLQELLDIATSPRDRVRPRWDNSVRVNWKGRPERQGQIVEAQQLLTELGPVFVELGLLRE